MIRSLLAFLTIIALGAPGGLILIGWCLITGDIMPLYRAGVGIVRIGLRVAGVRIEVDGLDLIPANTACVFMSNHVSNLDPPVLIPLIPGRTSVFLKRSLMKIPVLGYAMRLAEFVPVDRAGNMHNAQESVRVAKEVVAKGLHITTFVEGKRSSDGRLLPFKKGPFFLAMETGAPCIPVSISGTESMMGKGSSRVKPGTARVIFHPPIFPATMASREDLMAAVRTAVQEGLPQRMRS